MSCNNWIGCVASGAITQGTNVKVTAMARGLPVVAKSTDKTIAGGEKHFGVAMHDAADGEDVRVQLYDGTVIDYAVAGGALVPGTNDEITTDADGKYIAAAAGDVVLGAFLYAIDASGTDGTAAAGDLIAVMTKKYNWAA